MKLEGINAASQATQSDVTQDFWRVLLIWHADKERITYSHVSPNYDLYPLNTPIRAYGNIALLVDRPYTVSEIRAAFSRA